jgi:Protein of unknown function (DUF3515)
VLPQRLESLRPQVISPRSPLEHAWGHPAIILSCGVRAPAGYSATSSETTAVDGVRWFEQPGSKLVTWTAIRPRANVALEVPTSYQAQGAYLVDLAPALKTALP